MFTRFSVFLFVAVLFFACHSTARQRDDRRFVQVEGRKFIDPDGRQIIFSGINFISKDPRENYMPPQGKETFTQFKTWGFNCIRLGIIWDGLEPEPGIYNEEYVRENGEWKFSFIGTQWKYISPYDEGWAKNRGALLEALGQ